ncbi:hypothetical protein AL036_07365 [Salipiger aestuarii]|uniref:O-antigen ligase-like membrane protein n=1 Tax=Salipiger aestuarii TaxID=568098 RepID=A0A327YGM8_9RHOB|nr:hypothetical protein [Salipiger aestuarii]KAA8608472.1 hypothetical protein AL036_07365 [Salipiger aestuarii]KAA8612250.1 hypothetical protein AL037_07400 [Salipiger aestuarii]KAB2541378.1 hypothetical protein AL035_12565 [Salipiger aestuarii]RAK20033.1 hypothetical protein ATI53_100732 [Salipiger aestuarii]
MPNPLAYLMLAIWPVVTIALFRRLAADRALILSLVVGYLFLPEPPAAFDLPLMPPLNKHNIPALTAFAFCLWKYGPQGPEGATLLPRSLLGRGLLLVFVLSPIMTALGNTEPVFWGQIGLPALGIKDALALIVQQFLLILPFLLARQYLISGGAQRYFLLALLVGGLVYSLLMLIEMRLSPQLNNWIYGYYQHLFGQSIRAGGYRPVVFLYHGLWVAFFIFTSAVAGFALWRLDARMHNIKILAAALYLTAILVLAKSLGALIFAVALIPMVVFFTRLMQIRVAILIGLLAIGYPILKGAHLVPEDRILAAAANIDPERAHSLEFRFDNENTLLDRAYEKPVFGWGSWGRNHILDPVSGIILSVTDGRWIIVIGIYGWVGFLAEFGLLVLPLVLLWREAVAAKEDRISPFVAPLSLMLAINVFDMIPNATLTPLTWMVAGALTGYAESLKAARIKRGLAGDKALKWQSIM